MAALLAGARLVLRQGLRFLPAYSTVYRVLPAPVSVRYLHNSARFLTTALPDNGTVDVESVQSRDSPKTQPDGWSLHITGSKLKKNGRISKQHLLNTLENVCAAGKPSSNQAWFLLQACGSSMPEVPLAERTEIANTIWDRLQGMGVAFNEHHYNTLLKVYLENEHKFSPTEFLANMEANQIQANQSTYELLIAAYCHEGDIEGASKILGFMKSTDLPITEDVFSSLITGHARSGDMESAKNILSVMQGAGLVPRRGAYTALLCAYAEKGDIESINQTLLSCTTTPTDKGFLKVIYSLAKSGHSQLVPSIFDHMKNCTGYIQDVIKMCLALLTQGSGDTAILLAKKFLTVQPSDFDFSSQPGSFFLRHCVHLNLPAETIKNYAHEMASSELHHSPLQFALMCALEYGKKDLALNLIRTLKEEGLPVRPHYCWPLLASSSRKNDVQGCLQILAALQQMGVELDLDTFSIYIADLFRNLESPESVLQESGFQEEFNILYLATLRGGIVNKNLKRVHGLLTTNIPLVKSRSFTQIFAGAVPRNNDAQLLAKITKLLYQDSSRLLKPSSETESVGYFLYRLIDSMSDSEVQAKEEHLKQYFHQLKEMDVTVDDKKAVKIIELLKAREVPVLIEQFKKLVSAHVSAAKTVNIPEMEEQLEKRKANNEPFDKTLQSLLVALVAEENLDKVLELTSKYGDDFTFGMYMKVMGLCCNKNDPKEALKIMEEVKRKGFSDVPSTAKFIQLVKVLAINGHVEDAINVLKEMQERDVVVNEFSDKSFFHILNILAIKGDADSISRLHEHIIMLGLARPTSNFCSPLVMVHLHRKNPVAALDAMVHCHEKYKCCPMEYYLLLMLVEMGETDLLKKAVDYISYAMGERVMLHDLLFVFIETGKYAEALKIAETPGLRANPKKIDWFIQKYKKMNMVEVLEKCVEITRGLYESDRQEMYYHLLFLYEKNNDLTKATSLWHKMKEEGLPVRGKTADLFINLFKKSGENIFTHIPEFERDAGEDLKLEAIDISKKVVDLSEENNFNDAYTLFLEAEEKLRPLSKTAYTRLIKALLEEGLLENALRVEEAAKSHFSDYSMKNVSSNLLLAEQVRRDCLKDALVTLEKMFKNGRLPSRLTVNRLSDAFAVRGDLESLEALEKITIDSNLSLPKMNKQLFVSKLFAHFLNKNYEEATSLIESMYTEDPHNSIWPLLVKLMKNDMTEALEKLSIVAEKLSNQFSIYRLVTDLFLLYVQSAKVEEAKQLLQRCNGILEQSSVLRVHIIRQIYRGQQDTVYQLLDILADPLYKQLGYNYLMKHFTSTQKLDQAVALYEKMKAEEIEPNESYLKLLAVLLREADKPVPFPEPQESEKPFNEDQISTSSPSSTNEDKH